eukprot:symbB.v1.2.004809.t1/scaffold270.1/size246978/20
MTSLYQDAAFLYKGRQVLERAPPASQDTSQTTLATVTQDEVKIKEVEDGGQEVLPYFEARCFDEARGEAIRVFQVNGGGHYQMLADQQMVDG